MTSTILCKITRLSEKERTQNIKNSNPYKIIIHQCASVFTIETLKQLTWKRVIGPFWR